MKLNPPLRQTMSDIDGWIMLSKDGVFIQYLFFGYVDMPNYKKNNWDDHGVRKYDSEAGRFLANFNFNKIS